MPTAIIPNPVTPTAAPCVCCGTTEGSKRSDGPQYVRYRGERFGRAGMLCATCRAREIRHQRALALGFEPGKVGRRPSGAVPSRNRRRAGGPRDEAADASTRAALSPEQVAENLRAVREEGERNGRRPSAGTSLSELRQQRWADLAASDRRLVVEARRQAMARV
ncbi:hypothetical protein SAMN05444166_0265 [Singulisphaera sp. GP187]|uniref:hypothetical protein n=1 Tax=Singulisphaera sp. GP187 TaxID=1882752 RepID=UPI0009273BC4|nr:hypothetical protein [Singulisphaera sp. GP187]SIN70455.1 hypothetical protein SAMN05444166_0265 [Singulisphaera sp. GP187]